MTGGANYLAYLQELVHVSEQAQAAAQAQEWDDLVGCLSRRQELMEQIDALPDSARVLEPGDRENAARMLEHMAHLDTISSAAVETAATTARSVLQTNSQTRASISAYRRTAQGPRQGNEARFVDKNR